MKHIISCIIILCIAKFPEANKLHFTSNIDKNDSPNVFIITLDGLRWQEIFNGLDTNILDDKNYTKDAETINAMYGGGSVQENRKKLMPFLWNVVARKGQLYGNRNYNNNVNVANIFSISYPGYNEIFTGKTGIKVSSNKKKLNNNLNIFEYLHTKDKYKNKIAIFTSWDVFPYILNEKRSGIEINSGLENVSEDNPNLRKLNTVQNSMLFKKESTRNDMLTFVAAKEYLIKHNPSVFYIGLGETDEYAHNENYDMYLQKANEADKIIADLWHWVQATDGYKDNTTFIITTDHGRGSKASQWMNHGIITKGSSQTWVALLGKNVAALGEVKTNNQLYQKQIAQTIAYFLGEEFGKENTIEDVVMLE
jgi:hypothetical protein